MHARRKVGRTDVELVVVTAEAVGTSLLDRGLVADNQVGLAVLGRLLRLGRAGDAFGIVGASHFRA